jgi:PAS domain S-box-containing protein
MHHADTSLPQDIYALLIDSVQEYAIFMLDEAGIIRTWNKGAELIKGYQAGDVIGRHFEIFYTKTDRHLMLPSQYLREAARLGHAQHEGWRIRKDGSEFWANVTTTALYGEDRSLIGFSNVVRDMTSQRKAETEKKKIEQILDRTTEVARIGVWEVDLLNNTVTRSNVTLEIFEVPEGKPQDAVTGMDYFKEGEHRDRMHSAFREAVENGTPYDIEGILVTGTGREIWCRAIGQAEFKSGRCVRVFGVIQDIDAKKRAQIALELKEAQFSRSFEMSGIGMALVSLQSRPFLVNKKICDILGYTREELYSMHVSDITHPDDRAADAENSQRLLEGEFDHYTVTKRYIHRDGHIVWADLTVALVRDSQGLPLHAVCQIEDITERKEAREEKEKTQEILSVISKAARIGVWEVDMVRNAVTWDSVTAAIHGVPEGYEPGLDEALNFFKEGESRDIIRHVFDEAVRAGTPYDIELIIITAGGRELWCRAIGQAEFKDGRCIRVFGTIQDIDLQKRTQIELQLSEERFRLSFDLSGIGMALVSPDGIPIRVNKRLCDLLGYSPQEFYQRSVTDITHPDDIAADLDHARRLLSGEIGYYQMTKRYYHKNGSIIWSHLTVSLVRDQNKDPLHFVSEVEDITDKKHAEDELMRVNEELTAIFNSGTPVSIIGVDTDGIITHFNKGAEMMLGYTAGEMVGKTTPKLIHAYEELIKRGVELSKIYKKEINGFDVFVEPIKQGGSYSREWTYVRKDGSTLPVQVVVSSLVDENNNITGYLGIATDITQIKEAEASIRRYALLEAKNKEMEQLTFMASHDLLEPLQTVSSFVGLLTEEYHDKLDADAQKYIQFISGSTKRMMDLVRGLLFYSRLGRERRLEMTDLNELVKDVTEDLELTIADSGANMQVHPLPTLQVYPLEFKQLFKNLIVNAIKFRKPDVPLSIDISAECVNNQWNFVVRDNGIGIAERNKEKIFVIFQRLHDRHEYEGTGIGLAYCKKIVEMHNGNIWVESTPGEGSAFHFTIMT